MAVRDAAQPVDIAHERRVVEMQPLAQTRQRLGRGIAAEDAGGDVAGQDLEDRKMIERDEQQGQQRQQNSR